MLLRGVPVNGVARRAGPTFASGLRAAVFCALLLGARPFRAGAQYNFFDNGEVALIAVHSGGVLEPGVPLYLNGVGVNDPGTPGPDVFTIVEFYDRVPGT